MQRLERLYAITEELRRRAPERVSAAALAERFGVTRRTMERDLAALRGAGVPLYAEEGRGGGYSVVASGGRAVFNLSAEEATALLVAVAAADRAPFADAAEAAARRLIDALPAPTRVAADELVGRIRTSDRDWPAPARRVQRTVEEAVRQSRIVNLHYVDARGAETQRAVEAVGFHRGDDGWYLIAWCLLRDDRRIFRLDRIRRATLTKRTARPHDVDDTLGWLPRPARALTG